MMERRRVVGIPSPSVALRPSFSRMAGMCSVEMMPSPRSSKMENTAKVSTSDSKEVRAYNSTGTARFLVSATTNVPRSAPTSSADNSAALAMACFPST